MCHFFSFVSDGDTFYYFGPVDRLKKRLGIGRERKYSMDSHTSIADFHGIKGEQEDKLNKYEFFGDHVERDMIRFEESQDVVERFAKSLWWVPVAFWFMNCSTIFKKIQVFYVIRKARIKREFMHRGFSPATAKILLSHAGKMPKTVRGKLRRNIVLNLFLFRLKKDAGNFDEAMLWESTPQGWEYWNEMRDLERKHCH